MRFRDGASASDRAAARSSAGGMLERRDHARSLELLAVRGGVPGAVPALERRQDALYAEPNFIGGVAATPDDPRFQEQWGLLSSGQTVTDAAAGDSTGGSRHRNLVGDGTRSDLAKAVVKVVR